MNVILSIKPKYCERIRLGIKKYEFRKTIFRKNVDKVFIYSSHPVKKIVGSFEINELIKASPTYLWSICNGASGLTEREFFEYFNESKIGYALKIQNPAFFNPIDPHNVLQDFSAPQSFCYLNDIKQNTLNEHL